MNAATPGSEDAAPHLLIVDDEEIVLVALRDTLKREGYRVTTCGNALEALGLLKEQRFATIITDQQMPLITGLEFLAQVKDIQPFASRILITAVLSLNTVIDAINKGEIYRFLMKPWMREDLLSTVRGAVKRYEFLTANAGSAASRELESRAQKLSDRVESLEQELTQNRQHTECALALMKEISHAGGKAPSGDGLPPEVLMFAAVVTDLSNKLNLAADEKLVAQASTMAVSVKARLDSTPPMDEIACDYPDALAALRTTIMLASQMLRGRALGETRFPENCGRIGAILVTAAIFAVSKGSPAERVAKISQADLSCDDQMMAALQQLQLPGGDV